MPQARQKPPPPKFCKKRKMRYHSGMTVDFLTKPESALARMAAEIAAGRAPLPRGDGNFIDLFSGCGGTALGLMKAGWRGLFGVEKEGMAFETLAHNLVYERTCGAGFEWPEWLPVKPVSLQSLMRNHREELLGLRGEVDLVSGSPPCQGVSMAGRRKRDDWRNRLWREYAKFIGMVRPRLIFMESVKGFCHAYTGRDGRRLEPFSEKLMNRLGDDYHLDHVVLSCQLFGVPQRRKRFFMVGVRRDLIPRGESIAGWAGQAEETSMFFRQELGLADGGEMGVRGVLRDLETDGKNLVRCEDAPGRRLQIAYSPPDHPNAYLRLLRRGGGVPDSMRLARHGESIRRQFRTILRESTPGEIVSGKVHRKLRNRKRVRTLLASGQPACTVTTHPDDIVHYSEPRILTVRECARLQSFPDAFRFRGKYTTGGKKRRRECPRYTQVGNAVPPLAAEFWGRHVAWVSEVIRTGRGDNRRAA